MCNHIFLYTSCDGGDSVYFLQQVSEESVLLLLAQISSSLDDDDEHELDRHLWFPLLSSFTKSSSTLRRILRNFLAIDTR